MSKRGKEKNIEKVDPDVTRNRTMVYRFAAKYYTTELLLQYTYY